MTPKKPAAKKKAAKKPAAKRKPAAKPPEVNRTMTETATPPAETKSPNEVREDNGLQPVEQEETQEQRDAAGEARRQQVMAPGKPDPVEDYEQVHEPLENAGFDHYAAEEARQAELQAERDVHNERTGDASLS